MFPTERLERRLLLSGAVASVSLDEGILRIDGTEKGDSIVVELVNGEVSVTVNTETQRFATADVTSLDINSYQGADFIYISESVVLPSKILAGQGRDTVYGGGGNDDVDLGTGKDWANGRSGDDTKIGRAHV